MAVAAAIPHARNGHDHRPRILSGRDGHCHWNGPPHWFAERAEHHDRKPAQHIQQPPNYAQSYAQLQQIMEHLNVEHVRSPLECMMRLDGDRFSNYTTNKISVNR